MPNQPKATKTMIPVRLEREEINLLKREAKSRKMTLAALMRKIATGQIPLGDEPDNPPTIRADDEKN